MRIADIKYNDVANGDGISVSVWLQGCHHHCHKCFNPETWDFDGGKEFTHQDLENILKGLTANDIVRNLSLLGGDPMAEENLLLTYLLCQEAHKVSPQSKIYIWTGYTLEELLKMSNPKVKLILKMADVLIDGPYIDELRDITLPLRGSSNQKIIDLKNLTL